MRFGRCYVFSLLATSLPSDGPLRHLLIHPYFMSDVPDPPAVRQLLSRVPMLVSLRFEMPRVVSASETFTHIRARAENVYFSYEPGRLQEHVNATRHGCEKLTALSYKIWVVNADTLPTRAEEDDALRRRFPALKRGFGCVVC